MRDVKKAMDQNGKDWWVGHHHGFGMGVRNLIREGGFEWGPEELDDLFGLVERAVKEKNSHKTLNIQPRSRVSLFAQRY